MLGIYQWVDRNGRDGRLGTGDRLNKNENSKQKRTYNHPFCSRERAVDSSLPCATSDAVRNIFHLRNTWGTVDGTVRK